MKQTAVEYLWEKLFEIKNTVPFDEQIGAIMKAYNEAKEMEKQQIEKAFDAGVDSCNYGFQWADGEMYFETEYLN